MTGANGGGETERLFDVFLQFSISRTLGFRDVGYWDPSSVRWSPGIGSATHEIWDPGSISISDPAADNG